MFFGILQPAIKSCRNTRYSTDLILYIYYFYIVLGFNKLNNYTIKVYLKIECMHCMHLAYNYLFGDKLIITQNKRCIFYYIDNKYMDRTIYDIL